MNLIFHPKSPIKFNEEELYQLSLEGYRFFMGIGPNCEPVRTLLKTGSLINRLEIGQESDPIYQPPL